MAPRSTMTPATAAGLALGSALVACTAPSATQPDGPPRSPQSSSAGPTGATPRAAGDSTSPSRAPAVRAADFDQRRAMSAVRHLAGEVGPRHATSRAYRRASRWVARRLADLGYHVVRQPVRVPAGVSWGVPVKGGRATSVVAMSPDLDTTEPHLVVGAHLDTVPQAPGAEDNASGVGVLLAAAEAVSSARTRLPVVWVAFAAEEPRGPSDEDHHYGSRAYVASLGAARRRAVSGMVSLDRVGVGDAVPVGSALAEDPLQRSVLDVASREGIAATPEGDSRSSDHWSFVQAGMPGVRLGGTSYAAYHSAADLPRVVDRGQLRRTGRLLLAWLAPRR